MEFKDEECLVQSLKDLGFNPEVHSNGTLITPYYENREKPTAHVVVRKNQFGGMGDIGFERVKNGFKMHIDDYDYGSYRKKFNLNKLKTTYAENKIKQYCRRTSQCHILSRKENKNGQIEIQIRIND